MVNPISSNNAAARMPAAAQVPAKPEVAQTDVQTADVVQLSNASQAKLLKEQGFDIQQIAIKLGLDVNTVSTYFPLTSVNGSAATA